MKKFIVFLALGLCLGIGIEIPRLVLNSRAFAGVACTIPVTLTNGTTADATQVMSNFTALQTCLASAASAGINSDITALTGITTPLSPASGGTTVFAGGAATGTANAITLASTVPSSFTRTLDYCVTFVPIATNTGATTLTVNGTTVANLFKPTQTGPVALTGGEVVNGLILGACFDGTQYVIRTQATTASLNLINQVVSGGATVNPTVNGNLGTIPASGVINVNCGLSPLQYFINNGTMTINAPSSDGSCLLLWTNGATAGGISFGGGFSIGPNVGDAGDTVNGHRFIISITRINGISTWFLKALQ